MPASESRSPSGRRAGVRSRRQWARTAQAQRSPRWAGGPRLLRWRLSGPASMSACRASSSSTAGRHRSRTEVGRRAGPGRTGFRLVWRLTPWDRQGVSAASPGHGVRRMECRTPCCSRPHPSSSESSGGGAAAAASMASNRLVSLSCGRRRLDVSMCRRAAAVPVGGLKQGDALHRRRPL